jgi:adenylyltransferase/sulfurtransferase
MPTIPVHLPSVMAPMFDPLQFAVEAQTLQEALDVIRAEHPQVALHLFDESGGFREHVLCIYNDTLTRWLDDFDIPVVPGDSITFMQAVSGG